MTGDKSLQPGHGRTQCAVAVYESRAGVPRLSDDVSPRRDALNARVSPDHGEQLLEF